MNRAFFDTEDFIIRDGVLLKYDGVEEEVIIPPVVSVIGEEAFKERGFPKTIIIPEGVHTIESYAFYFCDVKKIVLPNSLKTIGERAFAFCRRLEKADLPGNVSELGPDVFLGCNSLECFCVQPENKTFFVKNGCLFRKEQGDVILLRCPSAVQRSFIVPEDTTVIADYAFYDCGGLSELSIPDSVKTLGPSSLYGLSRTCEVRLPKSFSVCETDTFQNRKIRQAREPKRNRSGFGFGVKVFTTAEEILEYDRQYKQNHLIQGAIKIKTENGIKSVTGCDKDIKGIVNVPAGVLYIEAFAFAYRTEITEVILPEGLRSIGESAFEGCASLRKIRIPDSVTDIGHNAFSGCRRLEEVAALNMLDPYPQSIYSSVDSFCPNGQ